MQDSKLQEWLDAVLVNRGEFAPSDAGRSRLKSMGILLEETKGGATWKRG